MSRRCWASRSCCWRRYCWCSAWGRKDGPATSWKGRAGTGARDWCRGPLCWCAGVMCGVSPGWGCTVWGRVKSAESWGWGPRWKCRQEVAWGCWDLWNGAPGREEHGCHRGRWGSGHLDAHPGLELGTQMFVSSSERQRGQRTGQLALITQKINVDFDFFPPKLIGIKTWDWVQSWFWLQSEVCTAGNWFSLFWFVCLKEKRNKSLNVSEKEKSSVV